MSEKELLEGSNQDDAGRQNEERAMDEDDPAEDNLSQITSVTQSLEIAPSTTRTNSNLTIENLRLHEEAVAKEERESQQGSLASTRGAPLEQHQRAVSPLAPVRSQSRNSSAGRSKSRQSPAAKSKSVPDIGEGENLPRPDSLRTGSGRPLPPIGGERSVLDNDEHTADDGLENNPEGSEQSNEEVDVGEKLNHPRILQRSFRRESLLSVPDTALSSQSERSVSFRDANIKRSDIPSPANKEVIKTTKDDGTEHVVVSIATETEWSWLESIKLAGKIDEDESRKPGTAVSSTSSFRRLQRKGVSSQSQDSDVSDMEDEKVDFDEEEGEEHGAESKIPPLQMDSDSEVDEDNMKDDLIPSIGPPRIIQYQREQERPYADIPEEEEVGPNQGYSDQRIALPGIDEEGTICEYCTKEVKNFPTPEMREMYPPEELYCCDDYRTFVEYTISNTPLFAQPSDEMIDIAPHAPYGSKQARRAAKERAAARLREREQARQRAAGANQANFYALQVARQMKTINYALSSQKCMDEGWTIRPTTPVESPPALLAYEPIPGSPPPIRSSIKGEMRTPIAEKYYASGQRFLVMFEDGSGTAFYPSGHPALIICRVGEGQYIFIAQDEKENGGSILAIFEPCGRGTCYHQNGNIRLNYDQYQGMFSDSHGAVKKRWSWRDQSTHVHAPPFQPICFALNKVLSVRCMTQDQIYLSYCQEKLSTRFNVGVKLKLVAPENIPIEEIDEDALFMADVTAYVQLVMDKISNQLHFSKSPKVDDIRPPRKVQNDFLRNEKQKIKNNQKKFGGKGIAVVTVN